MVIRALEREICLRLEFVAENEDVWVSREVGDGPERITEFTRSEDSRTM